ncbi:MAG: aminotransferase class IV [Bacillota bacterium]|uniref:aminotransferase class IV n=1 Tax=Desulforudis sp. DRI-14 TaxID=3459793 RepID=UPI00349B7F38
METLACVNGRILPAQERCVSPLDRGLQYGVGLFETLAVTDGRILFVREHLARLESGMAQLGIELGRHAGRLQEYLEMGRQANAIHRGSLRLTVTAGPAGCEGCAIVTPGPPPYGADCYRQGIRVGMCKVRRNPHSPIVRLKTLNYLDSLLGRQDARSNGWDEGILLNTEGAVAEGTASNVFLVHKGRLFTPHADCGLLPGIVRHIVLQAAGFLGIDVVEGCFGATALADADEIFLTNSLMGVMPVSLFNGRPVGVSVPGPVTALLMDAYERRARLNCAL